MEAGILQIFTKVKVFEISKHSVLKPPGMFEISKHSRVFPQLPLYKIVSFCQQYIFLISA